MLAEHQLVGVSVELFEGELGRVLAMDFAKRGRQAFPGSFEFDVVVVESLEHAPLALDVGESA
jgi:hypothetical protein